MSLKVDNLIDLPSGTKLKPGQRLIRIKDNIWMPVGVGGTDIPVFTGSGSTEYYRCASVDTETHTWTGYKATLSDDAYKFESTVTEGLSYSGVIPVVGKIYSADAHVCVESLYDGITQEGLVFYAPLSESRTAAETGQKLSASGTVQYIVEDGIPCMKIASLTSRVYATDQSALPMGASPRTISFWTKPLESVAGKGQFFLGYGNPNNSASVLIAYFGDNNRSLLYFDSYNIAVSKDIEFSYEWTNYVFTYSDSLLEMYINGEKIHEASIVLDTKTGYPQGLVIGNSPIGNYSQKILCCFAAVRVYDRKLSGEEIASLAAEFTPTQTEETT